MCCTSIWHFIWGRNECVTNEHQRTSAGRLPDLWINKFWPLRYLFATLLIMCTMIVRWRNSLCYIHTEEYSPKSYVVNFRTQISSRQSEEQTMFFTCEKNYTSNHKPQRCVSFAPKFTPFISACSAASHTFNEKGFTQRVFLAKRSEKHFGNGVE